MPKVRGSVMRSSLSQARDPCSVAPLGLGRLKIVFPIIRRSSCIATTLSECFTPNLCDKDYLSKLSWAGCAPGIHRLVHHTGAEAVCEVVGRVSHQDFHMTLHGRCLSDNQPLDTSMVSCTIISLASGRLRQSQTSGICHLRKLSEHLGPVPPSSDIVPGTLQVYWPLYVLMAHSERSPSRPCRPDPAIEAVAHQWHVSSDRTHAMAAISTMHCLNVIPVYDSDGHLVPPNEHKRCLHGKEVLVCFRVVHTSLQEASHTITYLLEKIVVLVN
ncbi:hypothetical protein K439DRAFT_1622652 [Ramaria rubella]|nr:hypothetical protein K439DRAFT_1622652 [Ramaria rubella]